ncbi:biotin transport system permease protein [Pseudooceanicola antarcticus]|uniref:Biotin transport system permease protein n=1 Tax=Pseudooceanicola antarcticus TaxID=1247613 RepID=A0A285IJE2_9RHOB|nr:energy-coupling factor transporter transmembrane component T [Pseudooceanicola antarcticus]PJE28827.1 energy-coupling factor transporter transmembrane protein EcfT [Pseudooceanicola antarcticus]SNY48109.1 biotin transport system permease protein [Pseudooceanicola antarcticus]
MISLTSPVRTRAHGWPAGAKLGGLLLATVALAASSSLVVLGAGAGLVLLLYALPGRVFLAHGLRRLAVLLPFVLVILGWHLLAAEPLVGLAICLRMVAAVALANLVTMTTRLSDMMQVLRRLGAPLARFGFNMRALEISIALLIRMIPVLSETGGHLRQSWRARSARRPGWRIIMPLTLATLDDADHVAEALKARGGIGGAGPEISDTDERKSQWKRP